MLIERNIINKTFHLPAVEIGTTEWDQNIVRVHKPEGTYTVVFGAHDIPEKITHVLKKTEGVLLETRPECIEDPRKFLGCTQNMGYGTIIKSLEKKAVPVYLTDWGLDTGVWLKESGIVFAESVAATAINRGLRKKGPENLTRRRLLQIGGAVTAAWLITPLLSLSARLGSATTNIGGETSAALYRFSNKLHPEQYLLSASLRNTVQAHKGEWLMRRMDKPSHFTLFAGALHSRIIDSIQASPEDRIRLLKMTKKIWESILPLEPLYKIAKFEFHERQWRLCEVFEVPELKALVLDEPPRPSTNPRDPKS